MACLDNIISYRSNCRGTKSVSGFYLEDIGITPLECGMYINQDYASGDELIEDKIRFGIEVVKSTLYNDLSSLFNVGSVIAQKTLGFYQDSLQLKPGSANTLGGIRLRVNESNSYLAAYISSISLQVASSGTIDVFIYDLISGKLLDTIPVETQANVVSTSYVHKMYAGGNRKIDLAIVYDTEGVSSNATLLTDSGCTHCNGYAYSNHFFTATPITINELSDKTALSVIGVQHTSGLSIDCSLQCSFDNWICQIANKMAMPILYKTGELIMEYALLHSNRMNSETMVDMERNRERKDQWAAAYNTSMYALIKNIKPINDRCFSCAENHKTKVILP